MASNLKVDIVRPTATNGSLSLKGDSGGSATTNGITVNSSGNTAITGTTTVSQLNAADGAEATPSITNTGDTNTGIYFPAADTVGVSTGGSERMRIDSSGNVGIGTDSPSYHLSVGDGTNSSEYIDIKTTNAGAGGILFSDTDANAQGIVEYLHSSDSMRFRTDNVVRMTIGSEGHVVTPYQSAFSATPVTQTNVTGDGTSYVFTGVSTWTEIFDQNNDFSNGTFTAPVTGKYLFTLRLPMSGMSPLHTVCIVYLNTSNRNYSFTMNPSSYYQPSFGGFVISFSQIADMDASDTAYLEIIVLNGSKTVDMTSTYGDGAFTGMLLG